MSRNSNMHRNTFGMLSYYRYYCKPTNTCLLNGLNCIIYLLSILKNIYNAMLEEEKTFFKIIFIFAKTEEKEKLIKV